MLIQCMASYPLILLLYYIKGERKSRNDVNEGTVSVSGTCSDIIFKKYLQLGSKSRTEGKKRVYFLYR